MKNLLNPSAYPAKPQENMDVCACWCVNVCRSLQVERFWLQSDAAVCVMAGLGLTRLHGELERRLGGGEAWKTAAWVFTLALLARMVHTNHR